MDRSKGTKQSLLAANETENRDTYEQGSTVKISP